MADLAHDIIQSKKLESDAKKAKEFLEEYDALMHRMLNFIKSNGHQPQEPTGYCKGILLTYAMEKLNDKIIQLH